MSDHLTDSELAAIRSRVDLAAKKLLTRPAAVVEAHGMPWLSDVLASAADVPALLAEVDRLRAENACLRDRLGGRR